MKEKLICMAKIINATDIAGSVNLLACIDCYTQNTRKLQYKSSKTGKNITRKRALQLCEKANFDLIGLEIIAEQKYEDQIHVDRIPVKKDSDSGNYNNVNKNGMNVPDYIFVNTEDTLLGQLNKARELYNNLNTLIKPVVQELRKLYYKKHREALLTTKKDEKNVFAPIKEKIKLVDIEIEANEEIINNIKENNAAAAKSKVKLGKLNKQKQDLLNILKEKTVLQAQKINRISKKYTAISAFLNNDYSNYTIVSIQLKTIINLCKLAVKHGLNKHSDICMFVAGINNYNKLLNDIKTTWEQYKKECITEDKNHIEQLKKRVFGVDIPQIDYSYPDVFFYPTVEIPLVCGQQITLKSILLASSQIHNSNKQHSKEKSKKSLEISMQMLKMRKEELLNKINTK